MNLELPDDHPIAQIIQDATEDDAQGRIFLTLTHFKSNGDTDRLIFAEIHSWTRRWGVPIHEGFENRFECEFRDPDAYQRALEAMTRWPEITGDSA